MHTSYCICSKAEVGGEWRPEEREEERGVGKGRGEEVGADKEEQEQEQEWGILDGRRMNDCE